MMKTCLRKKSNMVIHSTICLLSGKLSRDKVMIETGFDSEIWGISSCLAKTN